MNHKSISRIIGWLYISTVLAFLGSNLLLKGQLVDAGNIQKTFSMVAANANQYRLAISIDFLSMVAVMALAFSLYVILKPFNPYLALLALGWRIGEVIIQAAAIVPGFLLIKLSQSALSSSELAGVEPIGLMLILGSMKIVWISFVFLSLGSVFNNFLFYKSKLIPRGLAVYGLISTGLYTLGSLLVLFIDLPESAKMGMMMPLASFELALGFYLAIFGIKEKNQ